MSKSLCRVEIVFLLVLAILFAWGTALENTQQRMSDQMIRLHVSAHSDSQEDQEVKLKVRDAVLTAAEAITEEADTVMEAKEALMINLSVIEAVANQRLAELGRKETVNVSLSRELFGTRHYDSFSLPGGYYDALRVSIGSGEGRNWWCVVYPQICFSSTAEDTRALAVMGGMEETDILTIQMETPEYELKFKTLELFENMLGWFRSRGEGIPTSR